MHRPGAAERDQDILARILAPRHRHQAQRLDHVRADDLDDTVGGFDRFEFQRLALCATKSLLRQRRRRDETCRPTKKSGFSQPSVTSASVTVGSSAALGIASRARIGAGALRADFEQAALIDPGDAPASRSDLHEIQGWCRHQPLAGLEARHDARLAFFDDTGLCRRTRPCRKK